MFITLRNGTTPTKGTKYSACVDLYSSTDITLYAGDTKIVGLGVAIDDKWLRDKFTEHLDKESSVEEKNSAVQQYILFKESHYLALHPRSSLRANGITSNTGIIDIDYPKEIKIVLHGTDTLEGRYEIKKGDRIAQVMLQEHKSYLFNIDTEEEREDGFGSTDKCKVVVK